MRSAGPIIPWKPEMWKQIWKYSEPQSGLYVTLPDQGLVRNNGRKICGKVFVACGLCAGIVRILSGRGRRSQRSGFFYLLDGENFRFDIDWKNGFSIQISGINVFPEYHDDFKNAARESFQSGGMA